LKFIIIFCYLKEKNFVGPFFQRFDSTFCLFLEKSVENKIASQFPIVLSDVLKLNETQTKFKFNFVLCLLTEKISIFFHFSRF
jgi:hypothetical protein